MISTEDVAADVIVVGAGPAGSTLARHLADAGRRVLVLEKSSFPREKVCGDGLTPRAVHELDLLGLKTPEQDGWRKNRGLRLLGGGVRLQVPWPEISDFPDYGLVQTRSRFDQTLAEHAREGGAVVQERTSVTGPVIDERTGHVVGVTARPVDEKGRKAGEETTYRAPVVVAADGVGGRMALALGLAKRDDRPLGIAVRTYFTSPRHDDDWMEAWLELREGDSSTGPLLPGYGWVFGVGDGTSNVGLGVLDPGSGDSAGVTDYRDLLRRWTEAMPAEWRFREEDQVGPIRGAALPMAFNRTPHYTRGLVLVGDSGGMVNPFNGEGIAYAMQSARFAAHAVDQALDAADPRARERSLQSYPAAVRADLGGYYTLGRVFVSLIGHPEVMRLATRFGLPRPGLMKLVVKLLANLADPTSKDATDRVVVALKRLAPAS
jgi:menaquinone-9 beta-reductase